MSSPHSLRDQYSPHQSVWSFVPETNASASSSAAASAASSSTAKTYTWSTRTASAPNPLFDLSASLGPDGGTGFDVDVTLVLRSILASALLHYASTAIAMPWEVGKTLLQVQWVPRDATEQGPTSTEVIEEEEVISETSSEDESYFADPTSSGPSRYPAPRLADEQGYVVRRSVLEEGTRPEYIIPVGSADGVWGMMKRLGRFRPEGWLALWKGLLVSSVHDLASSSLQPVLNNLLQSIFYPSLPPFHYPHILLPVASHLLTGFLLSPLDLVRTRLIVQSSLPAHRTYTGPLDALSHILAHEGGLRGAYLHPHLLIPTLLEHALRPLVALALPGLLARWAGAGAIAEDTHPVAWAVADFAAGCAGLLVLLPVETVRRRLQVQTRGTARPIRTCVETRPVPYNGVVDALWHVLIEERSDLPLKRRGVKSKGDKKKDNKEIEKVDAEQAEDDEADSWWRHTGLKQLYRGFGMRLGASALVLVLGILTGGEERDVGWAEL